MDVFLRIAAVCLTAALFSAVLKKDSPATALLLSAAAGAAALYISHGTISEIVSFMTELSESSGIAAPVLSAVLKTVGIAILARLASDICTDAGMKSAASATETAASAAALYISIPLVKTLLQMIKNIL